MTEDEIVGWHHRLKGYEFEYAPGVGDGQGGLVCFSPWGCKASAMTEQLNWTELGWLVNNLRAASPSSATCALFHNVSPLLSIYHVAVYILIFFSIVFIDYEKVFDCEDHNKLWKILKEMRIPDHLTCLLRYLYVTVIQISGSNSQKVTWDNRLVPNRERSTSRLYIVTLLI